MKWGSLIPRLRAYVSRAAIEPAAVLEQPERITSKTVASIISALACEKTERKALAALAAVLLVAPELAECIPLSVLDRCLQSKGCSDAWQSLALLLLHTGRRQEIAAWLTSRWSNDSHGAATSWLLTASPESATRIVND